MIRTTRPSHNFLLLFGPSGCMPQLMFSFSLDQLPIDGHTFCRYLKLLEYIVFSFSIEDVRYEPPPPYEIRPVVLRPSLHPDLTGYLECVGGPIRLEDTLSPGCYSLYDPVEDELYQRFVGNGKDVGTIECFLARSSPPCFIPGSRDIINFDNADSSLVVPTKCIVTGSREDVSPSWIYPPAAFGREFESPHNIIPLSKLVRDHFYRNDFGIDVDDNYRIVKFTSIPSIELPRSLADKESYLHDKQDFLRGHFRHCLRVYMSGGCIIEDEQIMPMNPEDFDWFSAELEQRLCQVAINDSDSNSNSDVYDDKEWGWPPIDESDEWDSKVGSKDYKWDFYAGQ